MFKLVIADEEGTKTTVPLVRDEISIGRKEGNTIRLTERNISRSHAQLRRANGGFVLRDLGSYNGVLVNGQRIEGESTIKAGDQIKLGDYLMAVESDQPAVVDAKPVSPIPPTGRVPSSPIPPPPKVPSLEPGAPAAASGGRLVMLAGPTPGTEYALPASGAVRIGRGQELDVPIDHRSVSREHAELSLNADGARVLDLESANGLRVNGSVSRDRTLRGGDVIELGQVALRYVAPGEQYVFDPADAAPYLRASGNKMNWLLLAVGGLGLGAVAALVLGTGEDTTPTVTQLEPAPRVSAVAAAPAETAPSEAEEVAPAADPFDAALTACRDAVTGERFAEAVAHANSALKARPDDPQATDCLDVANAGHTDEQTYVRGKSALQSGDPVAAMAEFSRLTRKSPFADKPEIAEARQMIDDARRAAALRPSAPVASAAPRRPASRPQATAAPRAAPAPAPELAMPTGQSPFQVASACLARGDNQCVIKALTGKARTPQELGLLIETHRSLGNTDKATAGMEQYLKQFPTGPKAATYRRMLDRQGQ